MVFVPVGDKYGFHEPPYTKEELAELEAFIYKSPICQTGLRGSKEKEINHDKKDR